MVFTVDIEKQGREDDEDTKDCHGSHGVLEHDAGEDDGHHLPYRHDDDEGHRSKFVDRKINKILAHSRANAEDDAVQEEPGVLGHEGKGGVEDSLLEQRHAGQEAREQVDSSHHLYWAHFVLGEQFRLPVGGEGVKTHVSDQNEKSGECCASLDVLVIFITREECNHSNRYEDSHNILKVFILLVADDFAHQHNRYNLTGLGKHLCRKADILEGLVLTPA